MAGEKIGYPDKMYLEAGAHIELTAENVYEKAEMIVKVKEPQHREFSLLRKGQILFCFLHLGLVKE